MVCGKKGRQSGFSLVELIIVIAVVSILSGVTVAVVSRIQYGNSKKAAADLSATLSKMRMDSMTKNNSKYMYLYQKSDGIYMCVIEDPLFNGLTTRTELDSKLSTGSVNETRLGNNRLKYRVSGKNSTGNIAEKDLGMGSMIKINFNHETGAFNCCNDGDSSDNKFYSTIKICQSNGSGQYELKMVELTGKHVIR